MEHVNSRGQKYYLHGRIVTLKGGREQQIYWFAKTTRANDSVEALPAGYEIVENKRTGLPIARKVKV